MQLEVFSCMLIMSPYCVSDTGKSDFQPRSYILYITDLALHEESHETTYLYYLLYIFAQPFWRIAEVLILVIIYRTIAEFSLSNLAQKFAGLHKLLVLIIALISATAYGFYVAQIVTIMRGNRVTKLEYDGVRYASMAYYVIYLIAALLAGLESLTVLLKARSKVCSSPSFSLYFSVLTSSFAGYTVDASGRDALTHLTRPFLPCFPLHHAFCDSQRWLLRRW